MSLAQLQPADQLHVPVKLPSVPHFVPNTSCFQTSGSAHSLEKTTNMDDKYWACADAIPFSFYILIPSSVELWK